MILNTFVGSFVVLCGLYELGETNYCMKANIKQPQRRQILLGIIWEKLMESMKNNNKARCASTIGGT
ncbi:hypothetical protein V6Z11_A13G123300 [Gossypium hirsutum]